VSQAWGAPPLSFFVSINLAIKVIFSLPAARGIRALDQIIEWRGRPVAIRSDNGPEFIGERLSDWVEERGIGL
jgi:putative transposase